MSLETANHWEISEKNPQVAEKLLPEVEKKLKSEVKKDSQEKLSQLNDEKLQTITNKDFLKYSQETRLQSLATSPDGQKVTIEWIKSKQITDISFRFAFWENNQINENLQFKTTAGQILPNEVSSVISDGVEYSRAALDGEFFSQDNTRLEIFDKTNIIISQVRDEQEMTILEKQNQEKLAEFMKEQDDENLSPELKKAKEKFAKEWLSRGFGSDFIMKIFAAIFLGIGKIEKAIWAGEWENIFTQIDKAIWNENKDGANIDRNNMSDEQESSLVESFTLPENLPAVKFSPYPQLDSLADNYGIDPSFLYSIWAIESSAGANLNSRKENSGVTSYGMFQILDSNFIAWWESDLLNQIKQNPWDRELNIQALEMFLKNTPKVVSWLQSWDHHMIATYYNWGWYQKWAKENNAVAYNQKLQYYQNEYSKYKKLH